MGGDLVAGSWCRWPVSEVLSVLSIIDRTDGVASVGPGWIPLAWRAFWQVSLLVTWQLHTGFHALPRAGGSPPAVSAVLRFPGWGFSPRFTPGGTFPHFCRYALKMAVVSSWGRVIFMVKITGIFPGGSNFARGYNRWMRERAEVTKRD